MSSDYQLEDTLYLPFSTRAFGTGIPTALVSGVIDIYEDVTATPIITAETLTVTLNGHAGFNMITVTATAATGFESDKSYTAILDAGTVDGVSVIGEVVAHFTLDKSAAAKDVTGLSASSAGAFPIEATEDNTSGAIIDSVTFVGSVQGATTFANTAIENGVYHDIDDTANDIDIVYGFSIGGARMGTEMIFAGFVQGNSDEMTIKVYDHVGAVWDTLATINGTNGTNNVEIDKQLLSKHTGTGSELGKVYIRFDTDSTTPSNLSVDHLLVTAINLGTSVGYAKGAVWLDTLAGTAGTEPFVNGVADEKSLTIADALTIATAVGLRIIEVSAGSTVTLAATFAKNEMEGHEWTLALGAQNIESSRFAGANVSGTATGAGADFDACTFATASVVASEHRNCSYAGTLTLSAAGNYSFIDCQSGVAGPGAPTFALGTGAMTVEFRRWADSMNLTGITADDVITINGVLGTIDLGSPSGGTVEIRGTYKAITNVGSATVNTDGAIKGVDVIDVIRTNTVTLPGQETPTETPTIEEMLALIYKMAVHKKFQNKQLFELFAADGTTVDQKATVSDDGAEGIHGALVSGP